MKSHQLIFLCILSGILLALGWPAIGNFAPLLFVGFVPLLFVLEPSYLNKYKSGFTYGFLTFAVFNALSIWWIYCVSEGIATKLLAYIAAILLNATLMALVFWLFQYTRKHLGERQAYIALIAYWIGFEYFHFDWELTWPWFMLGNGLANQTTWIQWYEYTGTLGGSIWILTVNMLIFHILKNSILLGKSFKENRSLLISVSVILLLPIVVSKIMYANYEEKDNAVNITILQPNIDPYNEKYYLSHEEQLAKLLSLAEESVDGNTQYVVAPETALTEDIWENDPENSYTLPKIREFLKEHPSLSFVSGVSSYRLFLDGDELTGTARQFHNVDEWYDAYNAAILIDTSKELQLYHKSKLVQGVEKMPFATLLKPLEQMALDFGGTTGSLAGQEEPSVFSNGTTPVAPVICYESVYGEYVTEYVKKGAELIFILTNDGWWEDTPGYKQHMAYARLRAIETRRSIARAANTGTSCFINQRGDVLQSTAWWKPATLTDTLNANTDITFYVTFGDFLGRIAAFLSVAIFIYVLVLSIKKPKLA